MEKGLLMVGGRISKFNIIQSVEHPILRKTSHVNKVIMRSVHAKLVHPCSMHVIANNKEFC